MIQAKLTRSESGDEGTFGELLVLDRVFKTGELPWRDNNPDFSCIPAGTYQAKVTFSNRFQRPLYELQAVPAREHIRMHPANWMGDTKKGLKCQLEGCIALGFAVGQLEDQKAIQQSKAAVAEFMELTQSQDIELTIENCF